jgi:3'-5' exoribonuclease
VKSHYVSGLEGGQAVTSLFLVREKEIRTSPRTGTSWLQLELADRTGTISAKMWDNFSGIAGTFEPDDVVEIRGRVKLYNGQKELTVEQITPAAERDYDLSDFLPHTKYDVEKLYQELHAALDAMKNPWLKQLLVSVIEDPRIVPRLKRAPAAMTMHHAYLGGLLEHVVSLAGLARHLSLHYPELDADLLLAGVVLHDIGKIEELRYTRGIDYTTEGRLLGHITIGAGMAREKMKDIPNFPAPLAAVVEHLILSHHGSHEFGSPVLPRTREAMALHLLDEIDSKMGAMRATIESDSGTDEWTDRNPSLRRALLREEKFLACVEGPLSAPGPKEAAGPAAGGSAVARTTKARR